MSRKKLNISIGLLTGHVALRAHLFNLGLAERKDCVYAAKKKRIAFVFCVTVLPLLSLSLSLSLSHSLTLSLSLSLRKYTPRGHMFAEPSVIQNVRGG